MKLVMDNDLEIPHNNDLSIFFNVPRDYISRRHLPLCETCNNLKYIDGEPDCFAWRPGSKTVKYHSTVFDCYMYVCGFKNTTEEEFLELGNKPK